MQIRARTVEWDPPSSVGYWINQTSRKLLKRHEARLRPSGFGMSHLPVLLALERAGTLSQKELAQVARVEQPTMAEMLARLERDGMIQRELNPHDRRGSLVSLTERSRERLPLAKAALTEGERELTEGLSLAETAQLLELLQRVRQNLETVVG